jgi:hypothetical protein
LKTTNKGLLVIFSALTAFAAQAQTVAFPGAEGFGAMATGGRGGGIYHVTNLDDSGAGSFRDAVSKPNRTVVFDISGVIKMGDKIRADSNITIAGQTAPGDGVVLYGNGVSFSGNTIIRYMRFRGSMGMARGACTVAADHLKDIIFDHVSIQWGRWDNLHIENSSNITFQYCMIGEGIDPQRFGSLMEGPTDITVHHCLWIDNQSRNPKAKAVIEYVNNVVYNWGSGGFIGGHSAADHYQDILNNYFIAGPNSSNKFITMFTATDHVYQKGNYVDLDKDGQLNGRMVDDSDFVSATATVLKQSSTHDKTPVKMDDAATAYQKVIASVGASFKRDKVDARLISDLKSLGKNGLIIKADNESGGQPTIESVKGLVDTDGDGMPDDWEKKNGLNAKDAADGNGNKLSKQYTNVEMYINGLVSK